MRKIVLIVLAIVVVLAAGLTGAYAFCAAPGAGAADQLQPFADKPVVHRGLYDNEAGVPENSLPALERAVEQGYAIALDVQLTKDGVPIVFSDSDTARMCGTSGRVFEMTNAELHAMRLLDTDEWVPTLAQALEFIGARVPVLIEIKSFEGGNPRAIAAASARLLDAYEGPFVVQSINPYVLNWFKDNRPDILRGQLLLSDEGDSAEVSGVSRLALESMVTNVLSKPNFFSCDADAAHEQVFSTFRNMAKVECLAWDVKSQEELDRARESGFSGFVCDGFTPQF